MPPLTQPATGLRVLVVDDDADTADSVAELLTLHGHTVYVALDGASALSRAEAEWPDVVLLDLRMPGLDGCDVARVLRERCGANEKRPLLVALTGCNANDARLRTSGARFDLHLVKPVDPAVLIGVLARFQRVFARADPETDGEPDPAEEHPAAGGRALAVLNGCGSTSSRFVTALERVS